MFSFHDQGPRWRAEIVDASSGQKIAESYGRNQSGSAEIEHVHVQPQYRQQGWCSRLVSNVFDELQQRNVNRVTVTNTAEPAGAGFHCYHKAGTRAYNYECLNPGVYPHGTSAPQACVHMSFTR